MTFSSRDGIIDSHLHIWELGVSHYDWIKPELGFLYNDFPISEARFELSAAGVHNAILVQVEDSAADTKYMLSVAESNDWILGVVGWVDLEAPEKIAETLDSLSQYSKLVGIRHLIHDDPRTDFLKLKNVQESLRIISQKDLAFDVPDAWPKSLGDVSEIAGKLPELHIIIDHLGKPPLNPDERAVWNSQLRAAGKFDNVSTKFSGLLSAAQEYTSVSISPLFEEALSIFGPNRILFGGDWPVSSIDGHYSDTVEVLFELIATLSDSEQSAILQGNARAVYGLDSVVQFQSISAGGGR